MFILLGFRYKYTIIWLWSDINNSLNIAAGLLLEYCTEAS